MTEPTTQSLIERLTQTNQFHENADVSTAEVVAKLEAQAREIERLQKLTQTLLNDCNAWAQEVKTERRLSFRTERDALHAELAAIRAVPVSDVNAGLVGKPKYKECQNWREANQANKEWHEDITKKREIISALSAAHTQQAQKGGE